MGYLIVFGSVFIGIVAAAIAIDWRRRRRSSTHLPSSVAGLDHPVLPSYKNGEHGWSGTLGGGDGWT